MPESSPHVHIRGLGQPVDFKGRGGGRTKLIPEVSDRPAHGLALEAKLGEAVSHLGELARLQKQNKVPKNLRGVPITVISRPGIPIQLGELRQSSGGLSLFRVSRLHRDGTPQEAVLFVSTAGLTTLQRQLADYRNWRETGNEGERRPRRFWLFESVSDIRSVAPSDLASGKQGPDEIRKVWRVNLRITCADAFVLAAHRLLRTSPRIARAARFLIVVELECTANQLAQLALESAAVLSFAPASTFNSAFLSLDPEAQLDTAAAIFSGVPPDVAAPATVVLDTGIAVSNPVLASNINTSKCFAVAPTWTPIDLPEEGHGTKVAGVALYGDLAQPLSAGLAPAVARTWLESVRVVPPPSSHEFPTPADALVQAVTLVDDGARKRIYCLASTVKGEEDRGIPSETAVCVDDLAWNEGGEGRLFVVAAGNSPWTPTQPYVIDDYLERNARYSIETPGQAFNAICVGATTAKVTGGSTEALAPVGDLCPTSRTATFWPTKIKTAYKPDIVMEGGNHVVDRGTGTSRYARDLTVLSTSSNVGSATFSLIAETSAATAAAAGMATRLANSYPAFSAQTLRAMLIHSAEWNPAMRAAAEALVRRPNWPQPDLTKTLLCLYGWGIPDEQQVFLTAGNCLTLVVEDTLKPYSRVGNKTRLAKMHYHKLPWPTDCLRALGNEQVELRITLSYFIAPDQLEAERNKVGTYASHRLRFSVKAEGESDADAITKINAFEFDDDEDEDSDTDDAFPAISDTGWQLGLNFRHRGSIHRDSWYGRAAELAERDGICIFPGKGWAANIATEVSHTPVAYSLVVSIKTRRQDLPLRAEALAKAKARALNVVTAENLVY